jgi:hypothetical protein
MPFHARCIDRHLTDDTARRTEPNNKLQQVVSANPDFDLRATGCIDGELFHERGDTPGSQYLTHFEAYLLLLLQVISANPDLDLCATGCIDGELFHERGGTPGSQS